MKVTTDEIAHLEIAARIALERADLDVRDVVVAAALLSIAIDAFARDSRDNVQALIGNLHDAVCGRQK